MSERADVRTWPGRSTASARLRRVGAIVVIVVVLLALPLYLESFWLQSGLFAMAAVISAIGLTLLVGRAGQLSLGHAFFVAIGAYGYCYLTAPTDDPELAGLGLPPVVAMVLAVLAAGLAGAAFSPISGRLRGIYLGLASLGLVFLGQHILFNATALTGGYIGRNVEPFSVLGFSFSHTSPDDLTVLGVPYGPLERTWYLGLVLLALAWWTGRNIVEGRPGRALEAVRDSETAAGVMGVGVARYKAAAFVVSSMYAGLGGVLMAVAFSRIVPESFGLAMSIDFLVMIVIGGIGSIGGAVAGAVIVTMLPLVLDRYSDVLPFLADAGESGLTAAGLSRIVYGVAILLVLLFARGGLAGLARDLRRRRRPRTGDTHSSSTPPQSHPEPTEMKEPVR